MKFMHFHPVEKASLNRSKYRKVILDAMGYRNIDTYRNIAISHSQCKFEN